VNVQYKKAVRDFAARANREHGARQWPGPDAAGVLALFPRVHAWQRIADAVKHRRPLHQAIAALVIVVILAFVLSGGGLDGAPALAMRLARGARTLPLAVPAGTR
jgi:hypothetical protein